MLQALFSAQQDRRLRLYFGSANGIASSNLLMHTLFSLLVEKQIRVAVQKYNLSAVSSQQWATPLQAYLSLRHGTGLIIILAADVVEKALLKVVRKKGACIQDEREGKNKAPRRELIQKRKVLRAPDPPVPHVVKVSSGRLILLFTNQVLPHFHSLLLWAV